MKAPDERDRDEIAAPGTEVAVPRRVLVILTGSIAAYKACEVISQLVQAGVEVRAVATASALRMIGAPTLEGLTGRPVLSDLWEPGRALDHIQLTRWADLVLVCPATASILNRLAAGLADDLPGALFLAHDRRKPWLMAPAMNPAMWSHPMTVASVDRLRAVGVRFLPVAEGRTACGEVGEGRLADPQQVGVAVLAALARPPQRLRLLITSGGTEEPVDGVRVLTNRSTGRTGALLASGFQAGGHRVTLLRGRSAMAAPPGVDERVFGSFADLDGSLTQLLGQDHFDAVVHAAAVSDYGVEAVVQAGVARPPGTKLDSRQSVELRLVPHPKLVKTLRVRSRNPSVRIVAFKLTDHAEAGAVRLALDALWAEAAPDLIVHNDLADQGEKADDFPASIHVRGDAAPTRCASRTDLAAALETCLLKSILSPS